MSNYIGNQPSFGEFKKLDSIVSSFNGSTTQFDLDYNTVNQSVGDSTQLIVSLNGIVQEPGAAYTLGIGGGSIVFSSAPASTDTCHIVSLGGVGSTGTVADGSITAVKLASNLRDLLEEEFTGNGSATTFTMTRSVSYSNQLLVTISGVVQPTSAYSVSGTTLTISPALPNTTNIRILHIGLPGAFNSANSILPSMLSSTGGTANQVLAVNANANGIEFQTVSGGGGGGIALTDLSVSTASAGTAGLSYNNSSGLFTFTPPDLSSYLTSVSQSAVTQYQAALSITESQISDFGTYLTSVPAQTFASLTSKPTTISGYGITDALALGTSSTTALAGNTSLLALGTSSTTALAGNTTLFNGAFASLTSKPTTISGYGITDAATEFGLPADQSFTVVNSGSSAYTIGGGASGNNAALTLIRGRTYKFAVNASGHPFRINTSNTTGTGAAYVNGTAVINNGAAVGDIYFTVPDTAPDTLYYNCQHHSGMAGTINISSALVVDKANNVSVVGKTASNSDVVGVELHAAGQVYVTANNTLPFYINRKGTSGNNEFARFSDDGATRGTIASSFDNELTISASGTNSSGILFSQSNQVRPMKNGSTSSDTIDLGAGNGRWKDLYLSGGVYVGGTAAANKLDDYEEGSWSPHVKDSYNDATRISATSQGSYTKIGNVLHFAINIYANGVASTTFTGYPYISLPFTAASGGHNAGAAVYLGYFNGIGTAVQAYVVGSNTPKIRFSAQLTNPYGNSLANGNTWGGNVRIYFTGSVILD